MSRSARTAAAGGTSKTLGQTIRELREKRGWSLRKMAKVVGVSAPFLCDVEHDRRKTDRLDEIAVVLEVEPEKLRVLDNRVTADLKLWIEQNYPVLVLLRKMQASGRTVRIEMLPRVMKLVDHA